MAFKVFYISILFCTLYGIASSETKESYCFELAPTEIIKGLWSSPKRLPTVMDELRDTITGLLYTADDDELAYMTILSLWANDRLMGFDPEIPQSYIYAQMINETVAKLEGKIDRESQSTFTDFRDLCIGATDNSIDIGLRAAGCPSKKSKVNYPEMTFSISKNTVNKCCKNVKDSIPERLQNVIKRLINSKDGHEKVVGLGAIASATGSSLDFFSKIQSSPTFLKMIQLKACNRQIPAECCATRENLLKSYAKKLNSASKKVVDDMINNR
ncbi:uncharacterized protein LOC143923161 [Arctopsyche grandis]|uniref:uncharacterized protein LOC143923161 n=1 Tax=Arctopsyche grandis TaxID=121162 RepID=UPI00406D921D